MYRVWRTVFILYINKLQILFVCIPKKRELRHTHKKKYKNNADIYNNNNNNYNINSYSYKKPTITNNHPANKMQRNILRMWGYTNYCYCSFFCQYCQYELPNIWQNLTKSPPNGLLCLACFFEVSYLKDFFLNTFLPPSHRKTPHGLLTREN